MASIVAAVEVDSVYVLGAWWLSSQAFVGERPEVWCAVDEVDLGSTW